MDGPHNNYFVHFIREEIQLLNDKHVTIQWIPGHVGIIGNEEADVLANQGAYSDGISNLKISFSEALCAIKDLMMDEFQQEYQFMSRSKGIKHFESVIETLVS